MSIDPVMQGRGTLAAELKDARAELAAAHRELQGRVAQLVMLYRIGRDLSNHSNWDEALGKLLGSLKSFLSAKGAGLLLCSAGGETVQARRVDGLSPEVVERACRGLSASPPRQEEEPYLLALSDMMEHRPLPCVDRKEPWDETVVPLRHRDHDLGYLLLEKHYENGESIARDIYFLITIQTILTEEVAGAQAVSELRKLQRFQERTLDEVASAIVTFDEHGRRLYANRKGRELLGEEDTAPSTLRMGGEAVELSGWAAQAEAGAQLVGEGWLSLPKGESIPVSLRATRMAAEMPGEQHLVVIMEDQRAMRALEIERRRVSRQQADLIMAAEWAHDVRTPLTGILHSAELLCDALPTDSPKRRHFEVVRTEVGRINGLVSNFLDFARPVVLKRSRIDMSAFCRDLVEFMHGAAEKRGLELRFVEARSELELDADPSQLKQVLLNLFENSFDASPPGGEVLLRLDEELPPAEILAQRSTSKVIVLEVEDSGDGVPPEEIERLFVPFYTTKPEGTGLGLAISEKVIRAHHGHLRYLRRAGRTVLRAIIPKSSTGAAKRGSRSKLQARG